MTIGRPMSEGKIMRLSQAARKLNVGTTTIVAFLVEKGIKVENKPHAKITLDQFNMLAKEFAGAAVDKEEASEIAIGASYVDHPILIAKEVPKLAPKEQKIIPHHETVVPQLPGVSLVGKTSLEKRVSQPKKMKVHQPKYLRQSLQSHQCPQKKIKWFLLRGSP